MIVNPTKNAVSVMLLMLIERENNSFAKIKIDKTCGESVIEQ